VININSKYIVDLSGGSESMKLLQEKAEWGVLIHAYNPNIWEAETWGSSALGQPEICSETYFEILF
jgi:hypothetical protein